MGSALAHRATALGGHQVTVCARGARERGTYRGGHRARHAVIVGGEGWLGLVSRYDTRARCVPSDIVVRC